MIRYIICLLLFPIILFQFCSKESENKVLEETETIDKFATLKNSSFIFIIGNDVIPYEYHGHAQYDPLYYYEIPDLELYLQSYNKIVQDSLSNIKTDKVRFSSNTRIAGGNRTSREGYFILCENSSSHYNPGFTVWEGKENTWIHMGTSNGFNNSIFYIDLINDSLKLKNGFIGKISNFGDLSEYSVFSTPIKGLILEIKKEEKFIKFGNEVWEVTDEKEIYLYRPQQTNISYVCSDYDALMALVKKLNKTIKPTKFSFIFKLES